MRALRLSCRGAGAVLLVGASLLAWAAPATAHAILLRTQPSPQSTVAEAPAAVTLEFSESVEVAFGAIRVFDVDGRRVDRGRVQLLDGDRVARVPLERLRDGTYTVTWRVVSADGHPVRGGFQFYVGAPSAISPVAVGAESGAGPVVGWGYGFVRFVWFAAMATVAGFVVMRRLVWTPGSGAAGLSHSATAAAFRRRVAVALVGAWAALVVATSASIVFQAASVSGLGLSGSTKWPVLRQVVATRFGLAWRIEMLLSLLAVVPVAALARRRGLLRLPPDAWIATLGSLVFGICLAAGSAGHARTAPHPAWSVASVALHLLAVAVWLGGLGGLALLAAPAWRRLSQPEATDLLAELVPRFSRVALTAVGVVVVTGVGNSLANLHAVSDVWSTTYGRVLSLKVLLFVGALGLAARHLLVTPRRLAAGGSAAVDSFSRTVTAELALLVGALGVAASLVVLVPGRSLALAARGAVNQSRKAGAYTVQLFVDPSKTGPNEMHLTFVTGGGLGAADIAQATASTGPKGSDPVPLELRLIAPGHFVADAILPVAGRYRLVVRGAGAPAEATFDFTIAPESKRRG